MRVRGNMERAVVDVFARGCGWIERCAAELPSHAGGCRWLRSTALARVRGTWGVLECDRCPGDSCIMVWD